MPYLINLVEHASNPHQHKTHEIIYFGEGEGIFHCGGMQTPVGPGKIAIIPPDTVHHSAFEEKLSRIYISGDFHHIFNFPAPVVISDNPEHEGLLLAEMIYRNRYGNPEYLSALIDAFAHFLIQSLNMDDEVSLAVKDIVHEITAGFHDSHLDLAGLLKKSGYAEDYIRSQFKRITGKTPTEFLTKIRISHACFLIDSYKHSLTLSEIADSCGYTDYAYFSRRFKQFTGMSPREYMAV